MLIVGHIESVEQLADITAHVACMMYLFYCRYFSLGLAYTLNKQYSEAIDVSVMCVHVNWCAHLTLCTHVGIQ